MVDLHLFVLTAVGGVVVIGGFQSVIVCWRSSFPFWRHLGFGEARGAWKSEVRVQVSPLRQCEDVGVAGGWLKATESLASGEKAMEYDAAVVSYQLSRSSSFMWDIQESFL